MNSHVPRRLRIDGFAESHRSGATPRIAVALCLAFVIVRASGAQQVPEHAAAIPAATSFELPCDDYLRGLRGQGNFGSLITAEASPFRGTHHLAEDCWLPAGTEVRSVAAGVVRYSDFSPSWIDERKVTHWNLGNVVVIEHRLDPPGADLESLCSVYVHLAADRRVAVGDVVAKGQVIGRIGKDRSEENGLYPAHLHFGLHRGPYLQIAPSWRRELEQTARETGIVVGREEPIRGELEFVPQAGTSVLVRSRESGRSVLMSLLMGSSAPGRQPADIASWCSGYGDRLTVDEWLGASRWIPVRRADLERSPHRGAPGSEGRGPSVGRDPPAGELRTEDASARQRRLRPVPRP